MSTLPKARSRDDICDQVMLPRYADIVDEKLKKRFQLLDRPMGEGPPVLSPVDPKYQEVCREYLVNAGWEELGENMWKDPLSAGSPRGERQVVRMLKAKDKKTDEPLIQTVMQPAKCLHTMSSGVMTQRMRDSNPDSRGPTPLERIDKLAKVIDDQRLRDADLVSQLVGLSKRQVPSTPEQLRADAAFMRQALRVLADRLRPKDNVEAA